MEPGEAMKINADGKLVKAVLPVQMDAKRPITVIELCNLLVDLPEDAEVVTPEGWITGVRRSRNHPAITLFRES